MECRPIGSDVWPREDDYKLFCTSAGSVTTEQFVFLIKSALKPCPVIDSRS
jgi:hypothetical protein